VVLAGVSPGAIAELGGLVDAWTELAGAEREEIADRRRTSPEALRGALRGELESIVGKAVREDPEDRYLSVHAFANDLKAVLESRPVLAHRGSRVYGVRKWMRRHQVAAIVSFLLLTVVGMSAFGVALQGVRAAHQRRLAQTRLHDLVRLTGVLDGELYESARTVSKSDEARAVLLKGAADTLNKLSTDADKDPALEIELARQYKKLAQLHLDDTGADVSEQRRAASQSLEHGIALLNSLPKQDAQTVTMRDEMLSARQKIAE
jgi:serine/threonine-protein kinase